MIKVIVELHPFGNKAEKQILYEINVGNDGTGTPELGNYKYTIFDCRAGKLSKKGKLKNFDRSKSALGLLKKLFANSRWDKV